MDGRSMTLPSGAAVPSRSTDRPVCLHCGHCAALPRTAARGHFRTHAAQQNGPYSITSSVIASRVGGTVKPSDLAVVSQLDCGEPKITARFSYRPALLGARTKSNLFQG